MSAIGELEPELSPVELQIQLLAPGILIPAALAKAKGDFRLAAESLDWPLGEFLAKGIHAGVLPLAAADEFSLNQKPLASAAGA